MHFTYAARVTLLAVVVLESGVALIAAADDGMAFAADSTPSTLEVTATDAGKTLEQPSTVAIAAPRPAAKAPLPPAPVVSELHRLPDLTPAEQAAPPQGELTVVANPQRQGLLAALRPSKPSTIAVQASLDDEFQASDDESFEPEAARQTGTASQAPATRAAKWSNWLAGAGPRRPTPAAGIQPRQHATRFMPGSADGAGGYDPSDYVDAPQVIASREEVPLPVEPVDPAAALLVQAHELSLSAATEAEYSQIVRWCAEAMRHEPAEESRDFGVHLSSWALNRRGQLRNDEGERDLALADFGAALDVDPTNWRALHNRAVTRAQLGEFAEAFDDICRVIQLNPEFAKAYSNRATMYVQAGDTDKALADYDEALRLDPALTPALVGRGRLCHQTGRREEALATFDAAITIEPEAAEIVCSRGDLLADLGRYNEALADYARAIDLDPQFEHAYRNGAWLLATCPKEQIRDAQGALAGAKAALECGYGERHAALDTLAAAQANAGDFATALGTLQQAIDIAPTQVQEVYLARKQLYEAGQPFRTQPVTGVTTAGFEKNGAQ